MKAEKHIENESFIVVNPDYPVISKENALKAVEIAEKEMKEKAIKAFCFAYDFCYIENVDDCMGCDARHIFMNHLQTEK